jgi:adenylate kinase
MAKFIVLLGPPGAGKGTQAQKMSEALNLPHISSGDIFRENLKQQTELGKLAQGFMSRGKLVPDDVTIAMIKERLSRQDSKQGAILDGFPRTPAQAEALEEILNGLNGSVTTVPYISVPQQVLVDRLSGRWTCPECGHVYHEKFNPPSVDKKCDRDGAQLYQREDDKPDTVRNRIEVYFEQTAPLITFYREKSLLFEVDGTQEINEVTASILETLSE